MGTQSHSLWPEPSQAPAWERHLTQPWNELAGTLRAGRRGWSSRGKVQKASPLGGWVGAGQVGRGRDRPALGKERPGQDGVQPGVRGPHARLHSAIFWLWPTSRLSLLFVHSRPHRACLLVWPFMVCKPRQASKDGVPGNLVLSCIIEFTNSTFRNLTKQGICNSFKQGSAYDTSHDNQLVYHSEVPPNRC